MTISTAVQENIAIISKVDSNETFMKIVDNRQHNELSAFNEAEMIFKMVLCILLLIVVLLLCFVCERTNSLESGYSPDEPQDDDGE